MQALETVAEPMIVMLSSADWLPPDQIRYGLPLSKNGYVSQRMPRISLSMAAISSVMHRQYEPPHYAGNGVLRAMSQMKPASSRAMAASTRG